MLIESLETELTKVDQRPEPEGKTMQQHIGRSLPQLIKRHFQFNFDYVHFRGN